MFGLPKDLPETTAKPLDAVQKIATTIATAVAEEVSNLVENAAEAKDVDRENQMKPLYWIIGALSVVLVSLGAVYAVKRIRKYRKDERLKRPKCVTVCCCSRARGVDGVNDIEMQPLDQREPLPKEHEDPAVPGDADVDDRETPAKALVGENGHPQQEPRDGPQEAEEASHPSSDGSPASSRSCQSTMNQAWPNPLAQQSHEPSLPSISNRAVPDANQYSSSLPESTDPFYIAPNLVSGPTCPGTSFSSIITHPSDDGDGDDITMSQSMQPTHDPNNSEQGNVSS